MHKPFEREGLTVFPADDPHGWAVRIGDRISIPTDERTARAGWANALRLGYADVVLLTRETPWSEWVEVPTTREQRLAARLVPSGARAFSTIRGRH